MALLALLFTACEKEVVGPCMKETPADLKSMSTAGNAGTSEASGGQDEGAPDAGISDDGDDLAGSERTKKKVTN